MVLAEAVDRRVLEAAVAVLEKLALIDECKQDPAVLIGQMQAWDERDAVRFGFNMDDPDGPWYWQRELVDDITANRRLIILKARQLGVTWVAAAYGVWLMLYRPGSRVLVYRQKEDEAAEVVRRMWVLLNSLDKDLWNGATVVKPRNATPFNEIVLGFPGRIESVLRGMTSKESAGHGSTGAFVIVDEGAWIEKAGAIMKAVTAVLGRSGRLVVISTANGRHNMETQEGNEFHRWWETSEETGLVRKFLPWFMHPDRDQAWYDSSPETRMLKEHERLEQYPSTPEEAFSFSEAGYFDKEALLAYTHDPLRPVKRGTFRPTATGKALFCEEPAGLIRVFHLPEEGHKYALAADVATGRGQDSSAAYVIDLATMGFCAEIHGKPDADVYAEQLHYLGRWYNTAKIAIEDAGGWGEPVIIFLRDGRAGRPPYPNFYRHRQFSRADIPEHKPFGFPMNLKTRPVVIEGLERALRERVIPAMPETLIGEMGTFVYHDTGTSPRALDGCHDDRVMAAAVAVELYRQYGEHPDRHRSKGERGRKYKPSYPWEEAA